MIRVNLVRTVLLGGLALAVAADLATLVMLYAVALLLGFAETLFDTSAQSLLPAVVARDDLTRANSRLFAVAPGPMGLTKAGFGILTAAEGLGALAGSLLASPTERRLGRVRTLLLSVVLSAGCRGRAGRADRVPLRHRGGHRPGRGRRGGGGADRIGWPAPWRPPSWGSTPAAGTCST